MNSLYRRKKRGNQHFNGNLKEYTEWLKTKCIDLEECQELICDPATFVAPHVIYCKGEAFTILEKFNFNW